MSTTRRGSRAAITLGSAASSTSRTGLAPEAPDARAEATPEARFAPVSLERTPSPEASRAATSRRVGGGVPAGSRPPQRHEGAAAPEAHGVVGIDAELFEGNGDLRVGRGGQAQPPPVVGNHLVEGLVSVQGRRVPPLHTDVVAQRG